MLKEFKNFLMKGNLIDLAVAFIIGGAFKTILNSLVKDIIMPPIGLLLGGTSFKNLKYVLKSSTQTSEGVAINYGLFIQNGVDFLLIGLSIFIVIKAYGRIQKKKEESAPPAPSKQETLLEEIRDLLKK